MKKIYILALHGSNATQLSSEILYPFPGIGPTLNRTKTIPYIKVYHTKTSHNHHQLNHLKSTPHTLNHHTPPPFLAPSHKQVQETQEPGSLQSRYPSQITTSKNSQSPQIRCHIFRPSSNQFLVHQPATANSLHLQSTYTPHLQDLSNWRSIQNPVKHLWGSFFAEITNDLRSLPIFPKEFHRGCSAGS